MSVPSLSVEAALAAAGGGRRAAKRHIGRTTKPIDAYSSTGFRKKVIREPEARTQQDGTRYPVFRGASANW